MRKRVQLTITGAFQVEEYKNLIIDRVSRFNTEAIDPDHKPLVGRVWSPKPGTLEIIIEGDKEDLELLVPIFKRGPVISRIDKVREHWGSPRNSFKTFGRKIQGRGGRSPYGRGNRSRGGRGRGRGRGGHRGKGTPKDQKPQTSGNTEGQKKSGNRRRRRRRGGKKKPE